MFQVGDVLVAVDDVGNVIGDKKIKIINRPIEREKGKGRDKEYLWTSVDALYFSNDLSYAKNCFLKYTTRKYPETRLMLEREANFRMYFPYIEMIYDAFWAKSESNGIEVYCVCAEYIKGTDMKPQIISGIKDEMLFRIMMQLLYGVQYYVGYQKVDSYRHNDLKPQNIRLNNTCERSVICDFDASHAHGSERTRNGEVSSAGTAGYFPPNGEVRYNDVQVDIYCLGRVFCYLLAKNHYVDNSQIGNKNYNYGIFDKNGNYINRDFDIGLSKYNYQDKKYEKLLWIIHKMVSNPDERFKSVDEIIDRMYDFLVGFYTVQGKCDISIIKKICMNDAILQKQLPDVIKSPSKKYVINMLVNESYSNTVSLSNYGVLHFPDDSKSQVIDFYNYNGVIYYQIYSESWKKRNITENETYKLKVGDCFESEQEFIVIKDIWEI